MASAEETETAEPLLPSMEGEIGTKVCVVCKEENLQEEIHLLTCLRCAELFCLHFASSVDPTYCSDCNHKVELTDQTFVRTDTILSEDGKRSYIKTSKSRQLIFSGLDWLFFQRKIFTLSDIELSLAIEYHHTIYQSMLAERERRKIEYFHRNAGKQIKLHISTGDTISSNSKSVTVKQTKVTKVVKQATSDVQLKVMLQALLDSGLTPEQIKQKFK